MPLPVLLNASREKVAPLMAVFDMDWSGAVCATDTFSVHDVSSSAVISTEYLVNVCMLFAFSPRRTSHVAPTPTVSSGRGSDRFCNICCTPAIACESCGFEILLRSSLTSRVTARLLTTVVPESPFMSAVVLLNRVSTEGSMSGVSIQLTSVKVMEIVMSPVSLTAEVVWIKMLASDQPAKFDVGLKFTQLEPAAMRLLADVLGPPEEGDASDGEGSAV